MLSMLKYYISLENLSFSQQIRLLFLVTCRLIITHKLFANNFIYHRLFLYITYRNNNGFGEYNTPTLNFTQSVKCIDFKLLAIVAQRLIVIGLRVLAYRWKESNLHLFCRVVKSVNTLLR